ncbi:hypothetical protein [Arthrobacter castelli]|uniref:hypothetical protein n=1 Tax=Arthrobacter castelli TaxID=271431 RepID=UPI00047DDC75|nr:hypothetical protein [Arthrobacter castelli]
MPEYVLICLVLVLILIVGVGFMGTLSYLGYTGRWRRFLTMQPILMPVGRYWGLLTAALLGAAAFWACGAATLFVLPRTSIWAEEHSFWFLTLPTLVLFAGAYLFSWWLPYRLRPQWLIEHDRGTRYDPVVKAATAQARKQ